MTSTYPIKSTKIVPFQYERSTFTVFFFENKCVIFTMDKANGKTKKHPSRRVHFLLQKNTGNDERQIMTSKEVVSLALFSCHQPKAEDDDPEPTQKSERIKHTMDYESFKEKFVEDLKDRLDEQGGDVSRA